MEGREVMRSKEGEKEEEWTKGRRREEIRR